MAENITGAPSPARFQQWVPVLALVLGGASFAEHSGRALLVGPQVPSAFAAVAQSAPNSIAGLDIANRAAAGPAARGRRGGAGAGDPAGDRPASFGVAPAEPLNIGGRGLPVYRPETFATTPFSRAGALDFVPPDDVLPSAGGGVGNTAVDPTPAVPEPSSVLLTMFGMAMIGALAWRGGRRAPAKG